LPCAKGLELALPARELVVDLNHCGVELGVSRDGFLGVPLLRELLDFCIDVLPLGRDLQGRYLGDDRVYLYYSASSVSPKKRKKPPPTTP